MTKPTYNIEEPMLDARDIKGLWNLIQNNWHKSSGLLVVIVLALVILSFILKSLAISVFYSFIILAIVIITIIICWLVSKRVPKTPKNKVGFAVCIQCADDEEDKIIREDFIRTLRRILTGGEIGSTFHFIEIPRHISQDIHDHHSASQIREKTKAHFFIYGRVRLRSINKKECHVVELDGVVKHKSLAEKTREKLSKEFGELFPRRLHILKENDLLAFDFTSDWTECVSKYIIGIAFFCSSDLSYAESLYKDVQSKLEGTKCDFPIFKKLKERLPERFLEINTARAKFFLNSWVKNKDKEAIEEFYRYVNKLPETYKHYDVLLLKSFEYFLNGRNIQEAIKCCKKCKNFDDPVWHFNLAFLYAYKKELKTSIREYRNCAIFEVHAQVIADVEDFIVWILDEEPYMYQYYYCLGFFNWKIKGDLKQAIEDFELFLKHYKNKEFPNEKKLVHKWIKEIKKKEEAESIC